MQRPSGVPAAADAGAEAMSDPSDDRRKWKCLNCNAINGKRVDEPWRTLRCRECDWPIGDPVPDAPLCSICRRRHGNEVQHACE